MGGWKESRAIVGAGHATNLRIFFRQHSWRSRRAAPASTFTGRKSESSRPRNAALLLIGACLWPCHAVDALTGGVIHDVDDATSADGAVQKAVLQLEGNPEQVDAARLEPVDAGFGRRLGRR